MYVAGASGNSSGGFIARTTDGGQTWKEIIPADNFNKKEWIGVTSPDPDNIIVYGGADFSDLVMLDSQTWWCALDNDNIGLTNNAASSTWINQESAPGSQGYFLLGIDDYDNNGLNHTNPSENTLLAEGAKALHNAEVEFQKTRNSETNLVPANIRAHEGIWKIVTDPVTVDKDIVYAACYGGIIATEDCMAVNIFWERKNNN